MRLLIHLTDDAAVADVLAAAEGLGASYVRGPRADVPGDVGVAVFDDAADLPAVQAALGAVPGVRATEPDAPVWTAGPEEPEPGEEE